MSESSAAWIFTENLRAWLDLCSGHIGYRFDDLDLGAVRAGLLSTDSANDHWFEYPLTGDVEAVVRVAQDPGSSVVWVQLDGPEEVRTFSSVLVEAMQTYFLSKERAAYEDRWAP